LNRYLPEWVYSKWESWDNDFRWDSNSPTVKAMFYQRDVTNTVTEGFVVTYTDLQEFTISGAVETTSSVLIGLVATIVSLNIVF